MNMQITNNHVAARRKPKGSRPPKRHAPHPRYAIPPKRIQKLYREALRWEASNVELPDSVCWDEDSTELSSHLHLDAGSFVMDRLFELPPANLEDIADQDKFLVSPNGTFAYQNRIVPFGQSLNLHQYGICTFSDDVVVPMLLDMKIDKAGSRFPKSVPIPNRVRHGNVWMSLTPNEMVSQRAGIVTANGTVLVGGLGLSWFIKKVCQKDSVERVIVVEQSQELLDWYGYSLCGKYPKVCDVICDDVYQQLGKHGDDTIHLLDIWPIQDGVLSDQSFQIAKSQLGSRLWGWGEQI